MEVNFSRNQSESSLTEQRLRSVLYRFDCPSSLVIGEYVLDLLAEPARSELAQHALECELCTEELSTARAFLNTEVVVPSPGVWYGLRRVVASLFAPGAQPVFGAARGAESRASTEYRAGALKIVLGDLPGVRRGTLAIDGLLLHDDGPAELVANREVRLQRDDGQTYATQTDELGNFTFETIGRGTYTLEVMLAEEIIVVEGVHVGG